MVAVGQDAPSPVGGDVVWTLTVAGLIVGGAFGLFIGFGIVFWLFDPKAMEIPGLGDFAFVLSAMVGAAAMAGIGSQIGKYVGRVVARVRAR